MSVPKLKGILAVLGFWLFLVLYAVFTKVVAFIILLFAITVISGVIYLAAIDN